MAKPVGYLIKHRDGLQGDRGAVFDYVLGGNGVFAEAEGEFLAARVQAAWVPVRGLAPLEPKVVLRYGLVPKYLWNLALSVFLANPEEERYVAIAWRDGFYRLMKPDQAGELCHVKYSCVENTVVEIHSHGRGAPWFSKTDDEDEQGLKISGVVGHCDETPRVSFRVGVYGYFEDVSWSQIFDGTLRGVLEGPKEREVLDEAKNQEFLAGRQPNSGRRGWWDRFLRGGRVVPDPSCQPALDLDRP